MVRTRISILSRIKLGLQIKLAGQKQNPGDDLSSQT
ncbi:MAG: hypothetical protein ACD_52C00284G0001, partial [uncultured bacterium]